MSTELINPFDILSGKVVQNNNGTFWFKDAGNNMDEDDWPIYKNLHRENDLPAVICSWDKKEWWYNGKRHRENGPAVVRYEHKWWYINGESVKEEFIDYTSGAPVVKTVEYAIR